MKKILAHRGALYCYDCVMVVRDDERDVVAAAAGSQTVCTGCLWVVGERAVDSLLPHRSLLLAIRLGSSSGVVSPSLCLDGSG